MSMANTQLKNRIMRRVYAWYWVRQLTSPVLRASVFVVTVFGLTQIVSIPSIIANALTTSGLSGFMRLMADALVHTENSVLLFLFIALALAVWFIVDSIEVLGEQRFV